ncbi:MAG TPA: hypothetical protein VEK08_26695 [Planctomycetota bacterium]|nr:hypothetical protein [Planctomycetota bacterium]
MFARTNENVGSVDVAARNWNFSWSAVLAGTVAAMGLFILLMLFGTALGLSLLDPYQITRQESSYGFPAATIAWLTISALASIFFGTWLAASMTAADREGSLAQGALTWALCTILVAAGLGGLTALLPKAPADTPTAEQLSYGYSSLDDPQFADFVLDRARSWTPGNPEEPINVSADIKNRVDPEDIPDNGDLKKFIRANTSLNEQQTEQFLDSQKNVIAREQAEAQKRWEQRHANELARADRARKAATTVAWTLTAMAFLSLAAALGGSFLGWSRRGAVTAPQRDQGTLFDAPHVSEPDRPRSPDERPM